MSLELITESRAEKLIHAYGGLWAIEAELFSTQQQDGSGSLDVPANVLFSDESTGTYESPNGYIRYYHATGEIESLKGSQLLVKSVQRSARVGASGGTSMILVRAASSIDGGLTYQSTGLTRSIPIKDTNTVERFFDFSALFVPVAGLRFIQQWVRSSQNATGTKTYSNFGSLVPETVNSTNAANGFESSPSASVQIYRPLTAREAKLLGYKGA